MTREVIEGAAAMLKDNHRWTQGALGRNAKGYPCCFKRAESRDVIGAILAQGSQSAKAIKRDGVKSNAICEALATVQIAAAMKHRASAERVNDTTDHETVMALLRQAWKLAGSSSRSDNREAA